MDQNVIDKLKNAVTSKLSGQSDLRRNVIKNIEKGEQKESEEEKTHYLSFLKDKKDIIEIYKIIKSSKFSVREKRKKIKEFLNEPEQLNDFFNSILDTNTKHKEETKETTGAASAGGYSAPLFSSGPNSGSTSATTNNVKTIREQTEKVETKEATSSSSSGQYNQPAVWAKSLSKKNWKGASTKWMPGAKRVQVKDKCKKFPYCNQGDIKALNIFENETFKKVIKNISKKHGISENVIKSVLSYEYYNVK
jgi:hypothetical protein